MVRFLRPLATAIMAETSLRTDPFRRLLAMADKHAADHGLPGTDHGLPDDLD